jgi:hypothetical protein
MSRHHEVFSPINLIMIILGFSLPAHADEKIVPLNELVTEGFQLKSVTTSPSDKDPNLFFQIIYLQKETSIFACLASMDVMMSKESGSAVLCNQVTK